MICIYDVVIAGGGLGGLFAGALLARKGRRVCVLEKNATPGGGLQSFARGDVSFDTGMHVMGGWRPGGTLDRLCRYLGIRDRLRIHHIDDKCMDSVTSLADGKTYNIPAGRAAFVEYLSGLFPDQHDGLLRYVQAMYDIADSFDLYNLRPYSHGQPQQLPHEASLAADRFIRRYISDERLAALLAYINGLYDGCAGRTPVYVHALISVLYLKGASRFEGNSSSLAHELVRLIEYAGGNVSCRSEVIGLGFDESRNVTYMSCADGATYQGAKYIWAAHPAELMKVVPPGIFTKAYMRRVSGIEPTHSAFSLYIEFNPGCFAYIDHTCYVHDDLSGVWNLASTDDYGIPRGFMYMTPPHPNQGPWARTMLVTALMDYNVVERWADTTASTRPDAYYKWKENVADGILGKLSALYPEIRNCIKRIYTSSPLSIADWYHSPRGSIYGFSKDCENLIESQLPVVTKSPNLYLTGQCVNLHGICGVPLTALTTAEAVIFPDTIINEL